MDLKRENFLKAYPIMPDVVSSRMEATIASLQREETASRRRPVRKLSIALTFMLILLLAATGVAAVIHFGVFDFMTATFGQTGILPGAEDMVQTPTATLELPNTTIVLEEAVYDVGTLRVVYSVRLNDPAALPANPGALQQALTADNISVGGCDWFHLNGKEVVMTGGSYDAQVVEDDRLICYLDIQLASAGIFPEGDFTVALPLAGTTDARELLTFTVQANSAAIPETQLTTETVRATLKGMALSPVRAYVQLHIERLPDVSSEQFEAALGDWRDALLVDAQKNTLSAPEEILTTAYTPGESIDLSFTFAPTDAEEVWFAPTIITENDLWMPDMAHAFRIR